LVVAYESALKARRLEENLSRAALAKRVGCATSTIQFIEEGWKGYSPQTGRRIARVVGMTLEELTT